MTRSLPALTANSLVCSKSEVAFLDVRERGPHSLGHPVFAAPLPYSVLEAHIGTLVPRPDVDIILIDDGDGIAPDAALLLSGMGYTSVSWIDGGTKGWVDAGLQLIQGENVPSKTLGELAWEHFNPELITPDRLAGWIAEERPLNFYDCRPATEHRKMTIPGATCLPAGEIAHRLDEIDPNVPTVLTCAGRTRSTVAACSLALMDPQRRILALENGTQGWVLSGRQLKHGSEPHVPEPLSAELEDTTCRRAEQFLSQHGIPLIDAEAVSHLLSDKHHSTFLFDTRTAEEASGGSLPAFANASAGQLVQKTDGYVGVLRSRLILADDLGMRSAFAAVWLCRMGYEVMVTRINQSLRSIERTPWLAPPRLRVAEIEPHSALAEVRSGSSTILDFRPSAEFAELSVESTRWCSRTMIRSLATGKRWLVAGDAGPQAGLAAIEFQRLGFRNVALVRGGVPALREAGASMVKGRVPPNAADMSLFASERHEGNLEDSRTYLTWETGLTKCLSVDERACFEI